MTAPVHALSVAEVLDHAEAVLRDDEVDLSDVDSPEKAKEAQLELIAHIRDQLCDVLKADERRDYDLDLLSRWIVDHGCYVTGAMDHACARCIPGGPLVSSTFVCARHRSEDIQAELREANDG